MRAKKHQGFTVIELTIGIIAAAILALCIGSTMAFVYRGWVRSVAVADMEADAAIAIHTLDVAVRGASNAVVAGVDTLQVNMCSGGVVRAFSVRNRATAQGQRRDLMNGVAGGGAPIVANRLVSFVTSNNANAVWVTMTLQAIDKFNTDTGVRMGVTNLCIRMRNVP